MFRSPQDLLYPYIPERLFSASTPRRGGRQTTGLRQRGVRKMGNRRDMQTPRTVGARGLFSSQCRCSPGPRKGPRGVRPWDTRKQRVPTSPATFCTRFGVRRASHSTQPLSSSSGNVRTSTPAALHPWGLSRRWGCSALSCGTLTGWDCKLCGRL